MAFDYAAIKTDVADNLIEKFGAPVTLTLTIDGGGFDENGNIVAPSSSSITGNGVKLNYDKREIDGTNIVASDAKLLLGSASGTPVNGMSIELGGINWRVQDVMPLEPSGVTVMFTLQLRQG